MCAILQKYKYMIQYECLQFEAKHSRLLSQFRNIFGKQRPGGNSEIRVFLKSSSSIIKKLLMLPCTPQSRFVLEKAFVDLSNFGASK